MTEAFVNGLPAPTGRITTHHSTTQYALLDVYHTRFLRDECAESRSPLRGDEPQGQARSDGEPAIMMCGR